MARAPRSPRPADPEPPAPAGHRGGYMADGPGFHVWEESHAEALRSARELAGTLSLRQAARLSRWPAPESPEPRGAGPDAGEAPAD